MSSYHDTLPYSGLMYSQRCSVPCLASCENINQALHAWIIHFLTWHSLRDNRKHLLSGLACLQARWFYSGAPPAGCLCGRSLGLDGQPLKLPDLVVRSSRAFSLIANPPHELCILSPLEENVLILLLVSGVISVFGVPLFLHVCYPYLCCVGSGLLGGRVSRKPHRHQVRRRTLYCPATNQPQAGTWKALNPHWFPR